jgi:hypothetical protein
MWVKVGVKDLHIVFLRVRVFRENRRREDRTVVICVNACTQEEYDILDVNSLLIRQQSPRNNLELHNEVSRSVGLGNLICSVAGRIFPDVSGVRIGFVFSIMQSELSA